MTVPKLCLILPCFNEEATMDDTQSQLINLYKNLIPEGIISESSFIVFVDDGSRDSTWQMIVELNRTSEFVKGIKLSRNFGQQNALLAGLAVFQDKADCFITIDADLQDDIRAIRDMIMKYNQGFEIVYGVRNKRDTDSFFKKYTALFFYKLMIFMGADIVANHAHFRLSSARVLKELLRFNEVNLFLRGIYPLIGFKSTYAYYDRLERKAGETKYPFWKLVSVAWQGITSFSIRPLRVITIVGFLTFIISLCASVYALYSYFFLNSVKGWMSIVLPMYLLGGIQLLFIGVLGEYLAKIYVEIKKRPRFGIETELN